jgi:heme exporter protein D
MVWDAGVVAGVAIMTAAVTSVILWKAQQRDKERDRLAREQRNASRVQCDDGPAQQAPVDLHKLLEDRRRSLQKTGTTG